MKSFFSLIYLQWLNFLRFRAQALMVIQFGILLVIFFALAFPNLEKAPLILLFWTTILFLVFQSANYFLHQYSLSNLIFLFSLVSPFLFFISHLSFFWIYNFLSSFILYSLFSFFFSNWEFTILEVFMLILTLFGMTNVLIFLSFIAYKAQKQNNLIPILMVPLLLPKLLIIVQYTKGMLNYFKAIQFLGGIGIVYLLVGLALFPYLWSD